MAAVAVALAIAVVLVDDDLLAIGQIRGGSAHRIDQDLFTSAIVDQHRHGIAALGGRILGVGMIDVVAGAVGEHGVYEVGFDLWSKPEVAAAAAGVTIGRFVLEVPGHTGSIAFAVDAEVCVDEHRGRRNGVRVFDTLEDDAVLGLDAERLCDSHLQVLPGSHALDFTPAGT